MSAAPPPPDDGIELLDDALVEEIVEEDGLERIERQCAGFEERLAAVAKEPERAVRIAALHDLARAFPSRTPQVDIELARVHHAAGDLVAARAHAERCILLRPDLWNRMEAELQILAETGLAPRTGARLWYWGAATAEGDVVGGYRITRLASPAPDASIYEGVALGTNRAVSLRFIPSASEEELGELRAEHAGAVRIEGFARTVDRPMRLAGAWFQVVEAVPGIGVGYQYERAAPSLRVRVLLVRELLAAIERLHAAGRVHGRLSPGRLVWDDVGAGPQVIVFGAGRPVTADRTTAQARDRKMLAAIASFCIAGAEAANVDELLVLLDRVLPPEVPGSAELCSLLARWRENAPPSATQMVREWRDVTARVLPGETVTAARKAPTSHADPDPPPTARAAPPAPASPATKGTEAAGREVDRPFIQKIRDVSGPRAPAPRPRPSPSPPEPATDKPLIRRISPVRDPRGRRDP